MLFHDSHDPAYRRPLGPLPAGGEVTLRFLCDEADAVTLRTWNGAENRISMRALPGCLFEATLAVPDAPMLFWYDFIIHRPDGDARYGTPYDQLGGAGALYREQPQSYQITVYRANFETPAYLRHGVIYQIFPDRFYRDAGGFAGRESRVTAAHPEAVFHQRWDERPLLDIDPATQDNRALDFFGGTLTGIAEKLDELKELGVTVLYLNPVFLARTNHRYDTGSYEEIDPILGDEAAFLALLREADKRGMRVLLDGVFSHTGSDSRYFNRFGRYDTLGAYQSKESPYYPWYTFTDYPNRYRTWWGVDTLPAVNKDEPSYRAYLLDGERGVLPGWVNRGTAGWRLDVADELPMDLLREMRAAVKKANGDAALLGEVWEDASNKISYGALRSYCLGDTLDSVMNYPLRRAVIDFFTNKCDAGLLRRVILHQQEVYPAPFFYSLMNLLGSHDRVRVLNAMAGFDQAGAVQMDRREAAHVTLDEPQTAAAKKRVLAAYRLLCALPGAPTVYYGDELGMPGMADPWNRAPMAWADGDKDMRRALSALLRKRLASPLLQTGHLAVEAPSPDELVIRRFAVDGKDVFGQPLAENELTVRVSRRG